jgi:hypothetical protein
MWSASRPKPVAPVVDRTPTPSPSPAPTPPSASSSKPAARPAEPVPAKSAAEPTPPSKEVAPTTATLHIDSDVPGASVFIDRVYQGTTPITVPDVAPGSHRLNASATGYDGLIETIDVAPGPRDVMLKFKEVRLDVKIDVVHKHAVGSCTGTLSATPQGLRYDTSNTSDAFSVPLADLSSGFEVDYLAKNLKIKLRSGKTFNFTDPAGNADVLFAFHRDVDRARQKLAGGGH